MLSAQEKLDYLSKKLKETRSARRLSQQQVADILGVERSAYCRFELGSELPDEPTLAKIAKLFEVDAAELLPCDED